MTMLMFVWMLPVLHYGGTRSTLKTEDLYIASIMEAQFSSLDNDERND